jgi:hypothetical protein
MIPHANIAISKTIVKNHVSTTFDLKGAVVIFLIFFWVKVLQGQGQGKSTETKGNNAQLHPVVGWNEEWYIYIPDFK